MRTLQIIQDEVKSCTKCELHLTRTNTVFSRGNSSAKLMICGEGPGQEENFQGLPFVGRSGQLLDKTLTELGLDVANDIYVSNIVKCLRYTSKVQLGDGSYERIGRLVNKRYSGTVMSVDLKGNLVQKKVIGWHSSPLSNREVYKLSFASAKKNNKNGLASVDLTGDHLVLTNNGWKRVDSLLVESDKIATGLAISKSVYDVIVGTLLGDSHANKKSAHLSFSHSINQEEWLLFKSKFLKEFNPKVSYTTVYNKKYKKNYSIVQCRTLANRIIKYYRDKFYFNGIKTVPSDLELSPLSLAIWFMDDGYSKHKNQSIQSEIAAHSFDSIGIQILIDKLKLLGLESYTRQKSPGRIIFNVENSKKLSSLIAPYCPPSMRYKLHKEHQNSILIEPSIDTEHKIVIYDSIIIKKLDMNSVSDRTLFCLDVEDTHNFVTTGGVVHNCQPPGNRRPTEDEINCCIGYLEEQLQLVNPKIIVALGSTAVNVVMNTTYSITKIRGQFFKRNNYLVMPSWHPSYVLRNGSKGPIYEAFKQDLQLAINKSKE